MNDVLTEDLPARALLTPPHGRGLALLALATGGFAIGTGEFSMMGLLPSVAGGLGISVPRAGWLISAYAAGVVVGAPLIAVLLARMPRRRLLIGLMAVYAAGNVASALSNQFATIALFRFLAGLPHGAYFGIASLIAAAMVERSQRARAVGRMMLGLTTATIVGAPLAAWCGHLIDWHLAYGVVGAISLLTMALLAYTLPDIPAADGASALTELGALRRVQVWLALGTAAVGFGSLFAIYSYLSPALVAVTHMPPLLVPLLLVVLGIGMALGNTVGAWFADRALRRAVVGLLVWDVVMSLLFIPALPHVWAVTLDVFLVGAGVALAPALQTRLMDVAGDAQSLAASLNHSAFNIANGLGAALGGATIAAGYGWSSVGWVGAGFAICGLAIFLVAVLMERGARLSAIATEPAAQRLPAR